MLDRSQVGQSLVQQHLDCFDPGGGQLDRTFAERKVFEGVDQIGDLNLFADSNGMFFPKLLTTSTDCFFGFSCCHCFLLIGCRDWTCTSVLLVMSQTRSYFSTRRHCLLVDGFTTVLAASFVVPIGGMTRSTPIQCYTPTRLEIALTLPTGYGVSKVLTNLSINPHACWLRVAHPQMLDPEFHRSLTSASKKKSIKLEPMHPEEVDRQFKFRWKLHPWQEYTRLIHLLQHSFQNSGFRVSCTREYWFIGLLVYRLHPVFSSDFRTDFRNYWLSQYWRHLPLATWGSIRNISPLIRQYLDLLFQYL